MEFVDNPQGRGAINIVLYQLGLEERTNIDGFNNLGLNNIRTKK